MTTTKEEKKRQYYTIFRLLNENPRILPSAISKVIGTEPKTAGNRTNEAFKEGYIVGPHIRKRSFKNFIEYVYFVNCKDALEQYLKLSKDERFSYLAHLIN